MNIVMNTEKYTKVLEALAQGYDPVTGELFPDDSPYNHPDVIRALWIALDAMKGKSAPRQRLTTQEKQQKNIENGLPKNHMMPWTDHGKETATRMFHDGKDVAECADVLHRKRSSVVSFWLKAHLINEEQRQRLVNDGF